MNLSLNRAVEVVSLYGAEAGADVTAVEGVDSETHADWQKAAMTPMIVAMMTMALVNSLITAFHFAALWNCH